MPTESLNILIAAAEVAPFAKVGGLADVAGALPKALKALGHDVRVIMPSYRMIEDDPRYAVKELLAPFEVPMCEGCSEQASLRQTFIGSDIPVYLVHSDRFFGGATESRKVYSLEPDPYIFFSRAVAEVIPRLSPAWSPDVLHCNDWHTGLAPVYLERFYRDHPTWAQTARVFTIHNLAYQGDFDYNVLARAGLPDSLFTYDQLEFYGRVNFMKGGLIFSDCVNTVSEKYAQEIQTPEYGCRLEGLLRYLASQGRLSGIVNGIDYEEYDPATDPRIPAHYSSRDHAGKAACKAALQDACGLAQEPRTPLIGVISRLADQKGFDLIAEAADRLMALPIQFVVLGTGEPRYESLFSQLEKQHPGRVHAHIGFDAKLAQQIYAGCDVFLMPSRFEPCGLGQLMSLRYGTVPVVRATGGLADTVENYRADGTGNGFVFEEYSSTAMMESVERAVIAYDRPEHWSVLVSRAMTYDYSWDSSARKYVELYSGARLAARRAAA